MKDKPDPRHDLPKRRLTETGRIETPDGHTIHLSVGYDEDFLMRAIETPDGHTIHLSVGYDEDFLMRARVRGFDLAWRWPALENLSGRKPRGLGGIYGERALWAGFEAAADSLFFRSKVAVSAFCKRGCPRIGLGRCRFARFTRRPGSLRTRDFGRCG
ncbi:hypothetical protein [Tateyamaria sp.]|uniref:hypothetical protein n=1 Tax=Tateyamaria sp. TaxID=1929288 RepID=UPI003B2289EA